MTSQERRLFTDRAIRFVLANGLLPPELQRYEAYEGLELASDKFRATWFYLPKHDKWISCIDPDKALVFVQRDTVFKPLFEEYAQHMSMKLRQLDVLRYPTSEPDWSRMVHFPLGAQMMRERPVDDSVTPLEVNLHREAFPPDVADASYQVIMSEETAGAGGELRDISF